MSFRLPTLTRIALAVALSAVAVLVASVAFAQVSVEPAPGSTGIAQWLVLAIVGVIMMGVGYVVRSAQAQTETWAAPRRSKPEAEQTAADKAIIELDKKVDLINIDILERFLTSFVAARLPTVLAKVPALGPLVVAADMATAAFDEWNHRNPQTQAQMKVTKRAMEGKLAGALGDAAKDVLVEQLRKNGLPAIDPKQILMQL